MIRWNSHLCKTGINVTSNKDENWHSRDLRLGLYLTLSQHNHWDENIVKTLIFLFFQC